MEPVKYDGDETEEEEEEVGHASSSHADKTEASGGSSSAKQENKESPGNTRSCAVTDLTFRLNQDKSKVAVRDITDAVSRSKTYYADMVKRGVSLSFSTSMCRPYDHEKGFSSQPMVMTTLEGSIELLMRVAECDHEKLPQCCEVGAALCRRFGKCEEEISNILTNAKKYVSDNPSKQARRFLASKTSQCAKQEDSAIPPALLSVTPRESTDATSGTGGQGDSAPPSLHILARGNLEGGNSPDPSPGNACSSSGRMLGNGKERAGPVLPERHTKRKKSSESTDDESEGQESTDLISSIFSDRQAQERTMLLDRIRILTPEQRTALADNYRTYRDLNDGTVEQDKKDRLWNFLMPGT